MPAHDDSSAIEIYPEPSAGDAWLDSGSTVQREPILGIPGFIDRDSDSAERLDENEIEPGDHIGRYLIRSVLARGGMGVVYSASDRELGRKVAIKVVHRRAFAGIEIPARRERLMREAQALAQVSHPNIVTIYDVGTQGGALFIAMEFVTGTNLSTWLAEADHDWREILDMFLQAGRGLAAAHAAGLVHRDFKPANVLVGVDGRVRVADFGLARAMEGDPTPVPAANDDQSSVTRPVMLSARLTDANMVLGTTGYIAPEQLLRQPVGPHSDQFSFCVALYEALFGVRPFPGTDVIDMVTRFKRGEIAKPRRKRPGLPRRIRIAILRGLQTESKDRHPSMAALLRELACGRGRPPLTARVGQTVAVIGCAFVAAYAAVWLYDNVSNEPAPSATECRDSDSGSAGVRNY